MPAAPPLLRGLRLAHYRAIMVDPPWRFKSYAASTNPDSDRSVDRHYETMPLEAIRALPVGQHTARDAHLFLWTTGPTLDQAFSVIEAWGFRYSGIAFVWTKLRKSFDREQVRRLNNFDEAFHVGLGFTTRKNVELCLLGRRGNASRKARDVRELIIAPRREHSRKPTEVYARIERYCAGPYLELFSRSERPGWTCVGDQAGKFHG